MTKTRLLFLIILIEGYVVLAAELLAIRQMIPFVGSGTETISIIISAVLLPLALGYHAGGTAFSRSYLRSGISIRRLLLKNILSALAVLTLGLSYPFLELFFGIMAQYGITHRLTQTAAYAALFLVYPVFLLGQTVPLVSNYFSRARLSEITGRMLFFSTAGSFLGSVFSTIVLMMTIGVHHTVIATLGLLCVLVLLLSRKLLAFEPLLAAGIFGLLVLLNGAPTMRELGIISDNAYNTVSVVDLPEEGARLLNINRSTSSKLAADYERNFDYWKIIQRHFIDPLAASDPPHDILIIGAGGFTMGLNDSHNRYVFVDIDPVLKMISEEHFLNKKLEPNKHFSVASARAFLRQEQARYDLIIIDTYTNLYSIPAETTTREFFLDVKARLKSGGIVVANVIHSPRFDDKFSVRYMHTFESVFPTYSRQIAGNYNAWHNAPPTPKDPKVNNVLFIYFDSPHADDRKIYTDDLNTFSVDH